MHMISSLSGANLLLGSKSPRRRELLAKLDVAFESVEIDVDESFDNAMNCHHVAQYLAEKKSKAYTNLDPKKILITSDTTVICENTILNKPEDFKDAKRMLQQISGKTHVVNTGVCIRSTEKTVSFYEETEVVFKVLSDSEIEYYILTYKPFDKAGAYGIQEWIGMIGITSLNGCYYNVMGLPTNRLYNELCKF